MKIRTQYLPQVLRLCILFLIFFPTSKIYAQPTANFFLGPSTLCNNLPIDFYDNSFGNNLSYNWYFGHNASPQTATTVGPHSINFPIGPDTARLIVTDGVGLRDTFSLAFVVSGIAPFNINTTGGACENDPIQFSTTGTFSPTATFQWQFGPGATPQTSTSPNPGPIVFSQVGNNSIGVTVTDQGCFAIPTFTLSISAAPTAIAGNDTLVCSGSNLSLQGGGIGQGSLSFMWTCQDPGNCGLMNPGSANPLISPVMQQPLWDTMNYYLQVVDATGCTSDPDSVSIIIAESPIAMGGRDTMICLGDAVLLQGSYQAPHGFSGANWFPAISLSNPNILNPFAAPTQITTYALEVTDSLGCVSPYGITIITPLPCGQDSVWPGDANSDGA